MSRTMKDFLSEASNAAGRRILIRSLKRKLSSSWQMGGTMSLIAMVDESKGSVDEAVKALKSIDGVGNFKESKLVGGTTASFMGGKIAVVSAAGKIRVEYS